MDGGVTSTYSPDHHHLAVPAGAEQYRLQLPAGYNEGSPAMRHHEVFSRFWRYSGEVPAGYQVDFLGTQISDKFDLGLQGVSPYPEARQSQNVPYPQLDEEYFEWIDLLESVVAASGSYTMIELGAGYGRWAVRAAYAAQQYDPKLHCRVIAVEAEPTVFGWMREHFRHNGLKPRRHTLLHAAVTDEAGGSRVLYWRAPRRPV